MRFKLIIAALLFASATFAADPKIGSTPVTPNTRSVLTGAGLVGGGDLTVDRTHSIDLSTLVNNQTIFDSSQATRTFTFGLSGSTDPVITVANNSLAFNVPITSPGMVLNGEAVFNGALRYPFTTISALDIDWSQGNSFKKTLTANVSFTFSGLVDGRYVTVDLLQDNTGGRVPTWPLGITFINSVNQVAVPAINPTPNFHSIYTFWRDNGTIYCAGPSSAISQLQLDFESGNLTSASFLNQITDEIGTAGGLLRGTGGTLTSYTIADYIDLAEGSAPANPGSGKSRFYTKTGSGKVYSRDSSGNEYDLTSGIQKFRSFIVLSHPHMVDGTGAILQTASSSVPEFGEALFSNSAAASGNYVEYRISVPEDIDTTVDLKVERWKFKLSGADTGTHRYIISMQSVADSAAYLGTPANAVNMDFAGDASGASGDVETVSTASGGGPLILTNWKSNVTAGRLWVIRVARDGNNAADASTVNSYSGPLVLSYGATQ
jgi:hypothetical protein